MCSFADDVVAGGVGFPMHPHRDMEISTIVTSGAHLHEDRTGGMHRVDPRTVHTMRAGAGIQHAEVNAFVLALSPDVVRIDSSTFEHADRFDPRILVG